MGGSQSTAITAVIRRSHSWFFAHGSLVQKNTQLTGGGLPWQKRRMATRVRSTSGVDDGKQPPGELFATHLPALFEATQKIKLSLFTCIVRELKDRHGPDVAVNLAACVVHKLFLETLHEAQFVVYLRANRGLVAATTLKFCCEHEHVRTALAFTYAIRFMILGYEPSICEYDENSALVGRAAEFGISIPTLDDLGGPHALVNFVDYANRFAAFVDAS